MVFEGSPAEIAGLREAFVVSEFDGPTRSREHSVVDRFAPTLLNNDSELALNHPETYDVWPPICLRDVPRPRFVESDWLSAYEAEVGRWFWRW